MKNNKFSKILSLVLALSCCIGMFLPLSISAQTEAQAEVIPDIYSQNVEYNEKFSLVYAVDAATVTGSVKLYLYDKNPATGANPLKIYENPIHTEKDDEKYGTPRESYIFITDGVAAFAMLKDFYVKAVDTNGNESVVKKYSVAEYLYERIASGKARPEQVAFYTATIEFGSSAQKVVAKETDETKYVNNYCYVKALDDKTTVNGFANGVYPKGSAITLDTAGAEKCTVLTHNSNGYYVRETVNNGTSFTVPTNAVAINVFSDNVVVHRAQAETFEGYTVGDDVKYIVKNTGTVENYKYADAGDGHGKVIPVNPKEASTLDRRTIDTSIATAETATAAEISFDIRLNNGSYGNLFNLIQCIGTQTAAMRPMIYITDDNQLRVRDANNLSNNKYYSDISYGEWINIRMVTYKGDPNSYIYINGSDDYFVCQAKSDTYTGSLSTLGYARFEIKADIKAFEIDNFFYGYTMDPNPNAQ